MKQAVAGIVGPLLLGYGSGISLSAGFGPFGFSVLLDGLYQSFSIPFWISQTLITLTCYLIAWFWGRIPLGIGTVSTLLLIGPAISIGAAMTPESLPLLGNLIAFFVGLVLFSFGISLSAAANMGPDAITALSLAAEKVNSISIPLTSFLWNSIAICIGYLLGGNVGIASILGLWLTPLLIKAFLPRLRALMLPTNYKLKRAQVRN